MAASNVVSISDFRKVVIVDQVKALEAVKEKSEKVEAARQSKTTEEQKKTNDLLVENIKDLSKAIKENVRVAIKNGMGQKIGSDVVRKEEQGATGNRGMLRRFLIGDTKGEEEVKKKSWFNKVEQATGLKVGKYSPTGMIDKYLTKREDRQAHEAEKKEYVKNAMQFDFANKSNKGETGGVANLKNLNPEAAKKKAEEDFEKIKVKEKELAEIQKKVDAAKASGFGPTKKLVSERDAAATAIAEIDPRIRRNNVEPQKTDKVTAVQTEAANSSTFFSKNSEEKEEGDAERKKYEVDSITAENAMGATLIASLEVQKQTLEAIKSGGTGSGGGGGGGESGGGIIDSAMDMAGNLGKKGSSFLGKAGKFLGKAGPGLLKGGIGALGGMALEAGGDALKENGYEKTGGAVSTLGTAASYAGTGAMIGSVIPGVGTAIGAGVGGAIGLGKGLYDNWTSMFGGGEKKEGQPTKEGAAETPKKQAFSEYKGMSMEEIANAEAKKYGRDTPSITDKRAAQMMYKAANSDSPSVEPVGSNTGNIVAQKSEESAEAKDKMGKSSNNIVSAPTTNISNRSSQNNTMRPAIRHDEGSLNKYVANRYGAY